VANYQFTITAEGWSVSGSPASGVFVYDTLNGNPAGCLAGLIDDGNAASTSKGSLSLPVLTGDPMSIRVRAVLASGETGNISGTLNTGLGQIGWSFVVAAVPYDSGWTLFSDTIDSDGTVTTLTFEAATDITQEVTIYLDNVYVSESPASPFGFTRNAGGIPGSVMVS
jgi:hypothetical protein